MPDKDEVYKQMAAVKGVANAKNLEEYWIGSVGQILYDKFIDQYNKKMWLVDDNRVIDTFNWSPKGVALKTGPRAAWDTAMSAYPYAPDGYNKWFDVATEGAKGTPQHLDREIRLSAKRPWCWAGRNAVTTSSSTPYRLTFPLSFATASCLTLGAIFTRSCFRPSKCFRSTSTSSTTQTMRNSPGWSSTRSSLITSRLPH